MGGRDLARMRGGARCFEGEQGLRLGVIQQSQSGGEARKTLSRCQSVKRYFLSFFSSLLPFLNASMCEVGGGYCDGKFGVKHQNLFIAFVSLPGKILYLAPRAFLGRRLDSQLRSCPAVSQWLGWVFQPVFIPCISYCTLDGTEIVNATLKVHVESYRCLLDVGYYVYVKMEIKLTLFTCS